MIFILMVLLVLLMIPLVAFPKCPHQETKVDVLIVLGCPAYENGEMSITQKLRVEKAAQVLKQHHITSCILTGGKAHNEYSEAQMMAQYLLSLVDVHVFLEDESTTTFENMKYCQKICEDHQFKKIGVLTSGFHLNRAYAMSLKFFDDVVMFKAPYRFTFKKIFREIFARYVYLYYEIKLRKNK